MHSRLLFTILWISLRTNSTQAKEFYPIYDGLTSCNSLNCARGWSGLNGLQSISKQCTDPPLYIIELDSTSPSTQYITFNTEDLNIKSELYGKVMRMVGYVAIDIYFIGAWNNGLIKLTWHNVTYNIQYTTPATTFASKLCDSAQYTLSTYKFAIPAFGVSYTFKVETFAGKIAIKDYHHIY